MTGSTKKYKALLVDDEKQLLNILKQVIESIGMEPITASNGMEAFELYMKHHPDIIITDIYMPKMNGLILLKKVKADNPAKPVVLITGYAHYIQIVENLEAKPDGFLEKPFDLRNIIEIILSLFPDLRRV